VFGKEKEHHIQPKVFHTRPAGFETIMTRRLGFVLCAFGLLLWGCALRNDESDELLVLHAGSLSIPFRQISKAFMQEYPHVVVRTEAAGSRTCARKITELNTPADVMASADSEVIRELLMPQFADYCIDFSTNEMVIMYTKESFGAQEITSWNWPDILIGPGVEFGHSDPDADPCGYRTLFCWQLAEKFYDRPGLYRRLDQSCPPKNIRPKEVDLLALLETGELDYIFIYRSVAEQHQGLFLVLPDEINLKSPELAEYYRQARVELTGSTPGEKIVREGAPMVYGITIPNTVQSPLWAARFVAFVLGPEGKRIMEINGQPRISPARVDRFEAVPPLLKSLVHQKP
jgi:molybdate/tungstate transport system substrate-binding protein